MPAFLVAWSYTTAAPVPGSPTPRELDWEFMGRTEDDRLHQRFLILPEFRQIVRIDEFFQPLVETIVQQRGGGAGPGLRESVASAEFGMIVTDDRLLILDYVLCDERRDPGKERPGAPDQTGIGKVIPPLLQKSAGTRSPQVAGGPVVPAPRPRASQLGRNVLDRGFNPLLRLGQIADVVVLLANQTLVTSK